MFVFWDLGHSARRESLNPTQVADETHKAAFRSWVWVVAVNTVCSFEWSDRPDIRSIASNECHRQGLILVFYALSPNLKHAPWKFQDPQDEGPAQKDPVTDCDDVNQPGSLAEAISR